MKPNVVVVGGDVPFGAAVVKRLEADGFGVAALAASDDPQPGLAALRPDLSPQALVFLPRRPRVRRIADLEAEELISGTDAALVGAESSARYLLKSAPDGTPRRLVLVSGWAALGLPGATTASAVAGGLIGLAKSWALELGPAGVTVNAVVAGPGVEGSQWEKALPPIGRHPGDDDIAHAVRFFIDERSGGVNGQVMFVCGGLTPGIMPT